MAGGALLGALRVSLGLDSGQFEAGSKRARATADRDSKAIAKSYSSLSPALGGVATALKGFGTAALATLSVGAVVSLAKGGLEYASSLAEVAQQLGVTTDTLQEYRYAATQVGISQDEMDKGLAKLTRSIGDAAGGAKTQAAAFKTLGVDLFDTNGHLRSTDEILPDVIKGISGIATPAMQASLGADLLGKSAQRLMPLLAGGSQQANELRDAAHKLGIVISPEFIKRADDAADSLTKVSTVLNAKIAATVAENADSIVEMADAFGWLADQAGRALRTVNGLNRIRKEEGFFAGLGTSWDEQIAAGTAEGWRDRKVKQRDEAAAALELGRRRDSQFVPQLQAAFDKAAQDAFQADMGVIAANAKPDRPAGGGDKTLGSGGGGARGSARAVKPDRTEELKRMREELALQHQLQVAQASGDQARVTTLQSILDVRRATSQYEDAGLSKGAAFTAALKDQLQLDKAIGAARFEAWKVSVDDQALETARLDGDWTTVSVLERQVWLRTRAAQLSGLTADKAEAERQALLEWNAREDSQIAARNRAARDAETQRQIELGRLRGDSPDKMRSLERDAWLSRRTEELRQANALDATDPGAAAKQALTEWDEQDRARLQGEFRDTFKGGIRAALDGDFGSWLEDRWKSILEKGLDGVMNKLADAFADLLNNGGSGGGKGFGDILGSIAATFGGGGGSADIKADMSGFKGGLPGFANGGTFRVGGIPGADRNLLSINGIPRARVSANETISVSPRGSGAIVFDMRGAVVTEDLLRQAEQIATEATSKGISSSMKALARSSRQNLSRR